MPWEDTIGFGDGANDLEMIQYVQTGVAMGNADQAIMAAASVTTGNPDQDGIRTGFSALGLI